MKVNHLSINNTCRQNFNCSTWRQHYGSCAKDSFPCQTTGYNYKVILSFFHYPSHLDRWRRFFPHLKWLFLYSQNKKETTCIKHGSIILPIDMKRPRHYLCVWPNSNHSYMYVQFLALKRGAFTDIFLISGSISWRQNHCKWPVFQLLDCRTAENTIFTHFVQKGFRERQTDETWLKLFSM